MTLPGTELRDGEHVGTLIHPAGTPAAGLVIAHGGTDDGRRFFVPEAQEYAARGLAVLLTVTRLPPEHGDIDAVRAAIARSVRTYRWALDVLSAHTSRLGFYGHSNGAFLGTHLSVADPRVSRYVLAGFGCGTLVRLAAPQPAEYLAALARLDPRHHLAGRHPSRVFVQCGRHDDAVRPDEARALHEAAGPDAEWAEYDCGHAIDAPEAHRDRLAFFDPAGW